jgi:hypothetical protein
MLSFEQLSTPLKKSEVDEWTLEILKQFGFQTTGWQPGRIQRSLVDTFATLFADASEVVPTLAKAGTNETATGVALILYSKSRFDNDIIAAVKTAGPMVLTNLGTSGHTIQVGQLVARDNTGTKIFTNTTGGSLPAAVGSTPGTLTLQWVAAKAGGGYNVGNGTVTTLTTPISGVSISNPDSGSGNWFTTIGADQELDRTLRVRNSHKISTLALEWVRARYIYEALSLGARKVLIDDANPRGPGSVDVYLSGDYALYDDATMEVFQAAYAERTFQTESVWPVTDTPLPSHIYCRHPLTYEMDVQGIIYYDPQFSPVAMQNAVELALNDFLTLMPIGGNDLSPGPENIITKNDLAEAIEKVKGVRTSTITVPAGNTTINPKALVIPPTDGWFGSGLSLVPVTT